MLDKKFLKSLSVLYVEDDEITRDSLSEILSDFFAEVIVCDNGLEGLEQFKSHCLSQDKKIDAIVSDINMPHLNGIEMIKEIRKLDENVPVIFTTAHEESNYLMDAIKLKVSDYLLKPIDTNELLENIAKLCTVEYTKKLLAQKTTQLTQYMDIMDNLASIFTIDMQGNITSANKLLTTISGYTKEQLLTMNIADLLHPNSIMRNIDELLQTVTEKESFNAIVKFVSYEKETFYLNVNIITQYDDITHKINGFIIIGFDQTNDEVEKLHMMQRVRKNMLEQRAKIAELQKQIALLEEQNKQLQREHLNDSEVHMLFKKLQKEKTKNMKLHNQLAYYEEQLKFFEQKQNEIAQFENS